MKFEDIQVGDKAQITHRISEKDIEAFVKLTGDDNKLHTNKEYAATTSFKKPVAHGMISASFISTLIGTRIPGDGALWYEQHLEFILPVRVGDEITVQAEVIKKIDRLHAIELKTEIFNQHKQKVIGGTAKVKVTEQLLPEKKEAESNGSKCTLITGSTGGIGTALARKLASLGYDLILQYHSNKEKALQLKNELESTYQVSVYICQADISNEKEVLELLHYAINRAGSLQKMVHAATGPLPAISFDRLEWTDFTQHLDVHVKGLFLLVKSLIGLQPEIRYGKIVAISSQVTDQPSNNLMPYTTAKSAMEGLVKSLALDVARYGLRVNMVSPGLTDTDLNLDWSEKAKLMVASQTPLRRIASPEDIANAIQFLLSPDSDFITGETLRVNGGLIMK
ncbi:MAG: SDR family oxidoreductase [Cyclobacteriaceae bacterium]|nr:SDR family oxidoreductase [Cyclobacteriaceae bacterium]